MIEYRDTTLTVTVADSRVKFAGYSGADDGGELLFRVDMSPDGAREPAALLRNTANEVDLPKLIGGCALCRRWNVEVVWEAGGCYHRCVDVEACHHARYRRQ